MSKRKKTDADQPAGREAVPEGGTPGESQPLVVGQEIAADALSPDPDTAGADGGKPAGEPDAGAAAEDAAVAVGDEAAGEGRLEFEGETLDETAEGREPDRATAGQAAPAEALRAVSEEEQHGQEAGAGGDRDDEEPAASGQRDPDGEEPSQADGGDGEGDHATFLAVEFGKDCFVAKLMNGQQVMVLYDEVDWLKDASPAAQRDIDISPGVISWPTLDASVSRYLTLKDIYRLGKSEPGESGEHVHAPAADEDAEAEAVQAAIDLMEGMRAEAPPEDANMVAAFMAACVAFGTTDDDATTLPRFDRSWLTFVDGDHKAAIAMAAAFLRRAPQALPETLAIHLRRSGFHDTPAAVGRVAVAWKVFAFTLAELDALDRAEAEARERAAAEETARRGPAPVPRSQLAGLPADNDPRTQLGRLVK